MASTTSTTDGAKPRRRQYGDKPTEATDTEEEEEDEEDDEAEEQRTDDADDPKLQEMPTGPLWGYDGL